MGLFFEAPMSATEVTGNSEYSTGGSIPEK
jgi:hypothetical protein